MHLQSLELFGFKSFADKTIFNFHEGVTAIVGPNGCGKSNLLDAIRWVLGEQSAKSLRGGEMADVIFNGTDSRKPLGFAEVSVTFSDCATELGVDWHDVRVTRRVYRDGNSEYFLNKISCRLRDIQNLFADTGVARSAYSMMEQGKIDMILSSRPEDRRAVFEEAAGITKYKTQKREALRKLEATEANLLRIGDVIKEVKRQIGSLQRQAGKARRYQALHADLRVLDTHHSRKQLDSLQTQLQNCRTEIGGLSGLEEEIRGKIESGETEIAQQRQALDKIDVQIAEMRSEIQRFQSEMTAHQSRIEFNRQRGDELRELIERARDEIGAAKARRAQQSAQMRDADSAIEKSRAILKVREADLEKLTSALAEVRSQRMKREEEAKELQLAIAKSESRISTFGEELTGTIARRDATFAQIDAFATSIKDASTTRDKIASEIAAARAAIVTEHEQVAGLLINSQTAEKELERTNERLSEAEKTLTELERTLAEKKSRLDVLRQLNQEGRGLAEGSQAVLTELDGRLHESVVGPLVSQLDVDPKFIPAIEAALGSNLHAIVLNNAGAAGDIIARLTRKKLGRTGLLVPQLSPSFQHSVRKVLPKNATAWAIDKVAAPRQLEPLIRHLLDGVAIFSKLDEALECKKNDPSLALATLNGEFISTAGVVFGGSATTKSDSLLERKAEIADLEKEIDGLNEQRNVREAQCRQAEMAVAAALENVAQSRERHHTAHISHSTSNERIALREREQEAVDRKIADLASEKTTLEQQIAVADKRIAEVQKEIKDVRALLTEQQSSQSSANAAQEEAASDEVVATEKINELRLAIATERQRQDSFAVQRAPMAAREVELAELIASREADISNYERKISNQAIESSDSEASIEQQKRRSKEAESAAAKIAEQRGGHLAHISECEGTLRQLRNSLSESHDHRGQLQVRESKLQMQIDNLTENVERRYHIDIRGFAPDPPAFEKILRAVLKRTEKETAATAHLDLADEDLQRLIGDLTRQLENMGPVNLEAVQEYDELEERYKFLEAQNNDLTNSRRELLDVIARINSTTRKLFAETFAQVRTNFREMFSELFGGGRADLSLMDENDPLNCGIEIVAKPPGKQLQSISLLSGGERAMTAVALLFSIYMVRPSPFCVLDEMDAPLDESNINRFVLVLDRFVRQSQFIIITHNKRTIAKADVLYGVTMEERGVSKLVGMKLSSPPLAAESPIASQPVPTQRQFSLVENGNGEHKASRAAR